MKKTRTKHSPAFKAKVALEALRDATRDGTTSADEILRAAEVCRARTVIRPYVEALVQ